MGDESYGSNEGYFELKAQIPETFGPAWAQKDPVRENFFIFHQGRAAEHNFFNLFSGELRRRVPENDRELPDSLPAVLRERIDSRLEGMRQPYFIIPSNSHFDTTEGNIEDSRMIPLNLPAPEHLAGDETFPFRGNMDLEALEAVLDTLNSRVPLVYMTITNNTGGGQPVSMDNIRRVSKLAEKYDVPFFFDACRFAENAWFIQKKESGYANKSILEIVHEMFGFVDGFHISFKKDGLVNIGGGMVFKEDGRFTRKYSDFWMKMVDRQILVEGHPTYGGLAGRDLKALVQGLKLVVKQEYIDYRINQVVKFGTKLVEYGSPARHARRRARRLHRSRSILRGHALAGRGFQRGRVHRAHAHRRSSPLRDRPLRLRKVQGRKGNPAQSAREFHPRSGSTPHLRGSRSLRRRRDHESPGRAQRPHSCCRSGVRERSLPAAFQEPVPLQKMKGRTPVQRRGGALEIIGVPPSNSGGSLIMGG